MGDLDLVLVEQCRIEICDAERIGDGGISCLPNRLPGTSGISKALIPVPMIRLSRVLSSMNADI
jgi:hypothetical protein